MTVTNKEVRQARAWLSNKGMTLVGKPITSTDIPPRLFAETAKRTGKSFDDLLRFLARAKMGGQGLGQSPIADEV